MLSQILTLYTTPVVYLYLDKLGAWLTRQPQGASSPSPPPSRKKRCIMNPFDKVTTGMTAERSWSSPE